MPKNTLYNQLKEIVKESTQRPEGVVANLKGVVEITREVTGRTGSHKWFVMSADLTQPIFPTVDQFLAQYTFDQSSGDVITPGEDVAAVFRPRQTATLLYGSVFVNGPASLSFDIEAPGYEIGLFVGADRRIARERMTAAPTVSAGATDVFILIYGQSSADVRILGPSNAEIREVEQELPAPVWAANVEAVYLDPTTGFIANKLAWANSARAYSWQVYRAEATVLDTILNTTLVSGQYQIDLIAAEHPFEIGQHLYTDRFYAGVIVDVTYPLAGDTRLLVERSLTAPSSVSEWNGRSVVTFGEYASLARVTPTEAAVSTFFDGAVTPGKSYLYALTAFGFTRQAESVYSTPGYVYTNDVTAPASVSGVTATTHSDKIHVAFTAPSDPDYAGVGVYLFNGGVYTLITESFGTPGSASQIVFSAPATGTYWLRTFDSAGNRQAEGAGVSFTATVSEQTLPFGVVTATVTPAGVVTIQFSGNQHANSFAYKVSETAFSGSPTGATVVNARSGSIPIPTGTIHLTDGQTCFVEAWFYGSASGAGLVGPRITTQVSFASVILPTIAEVPSETGTTGTLALTINDPQTRVTQVAFKSKSGNAAWPGAWTVDPSAPYAATVTLVEDHQSHIAYQVTYNDATGTSRTIEGVVGFDIDDMPVVGPPVLDFNAADALIVSAAGNSDTTAIYITASTSGAPADPTNTVNNGSISGRAGTSVPLAITVRRNQTVFVKVRAYNGTKAGPVVSVQHLRPMWYTPSVQETVSEASGVGTLNLTVSDPLGRVTQVAFATQSGPAAMSAFVADTTPYAASVNLHEDHISKIAYRVRFNDETGVSRDIINVVTFDADSDATVTAPGINFGPDGAVTVGSSGDSDTDAIYVRVTIDGTLPVDPTALSNDGVITSRSGSVLTSRICALGGLARVKVRGYNAAGVAGAVMYAEATRDVGAAQGPRAFIGSSSENDTTLTVRYEGEAGVGGSAPLEYSRAIFTYNGTIDLTTGWSPYAGLPSGGVTEVITRDPKFRKGVAMRVRDAEGNFSSPAFFTVDPVLEGVNTDGLVNPDKNLSGMTIVPRQVGKQAHGVFMESFDDGIDGWQHRTGSGAVTTVSGEGQAGGKVVRVTGGRAWRTWQYNIPFDPSKLYRLRARVRCAFKEAGINETVFLGVLGVAADGTTLVDTAGVNQYQGAHWVAANGYNLDNVTEDVWVEFTGYFKGWGTPVLPPSTQTVGSPLTPMALNANIRYFRPCFVVLPTSATTAIVELDEFAIDILDEDAAFRVYTGLDGSTGYVKSGVQDAAIIKGRQAGVVSDDSETGRKGVGNVAANLITNGGGQDDPIGTIPATGWPNTSGNSVSVVNDAYKLGDRALRINNATSANSSSLRTITISAGDVIEIEAWMKVTGVSGAGLGGLIYLNDPGAGMVWIEGATIGTRDASNLRFGPGQGTQDWALYRVVIRCTQSGTLNLYAQLGNLGNVTGTVWFDGITVRKIPAEAAKRALDALDADGKVKRGTTIGGTPAIIAARQAHGIFLETFEELPDYWVVVNAATSMTSQSAGQAGGKVVQLQGQSWYYFPYNIPYDPSKLYRIRARVRQTVAGTAGAGEGFYMGITGVGADGAILVNQDGNNSASSQHYIGAANADLGANGLNVWKEYTGYFKGWGAVAAENCNGGGTDPWNYARLHPNVRYFRPTFIANYSGGTGTAQIDYIAIDIVDALPDAEAARKAAGSPSDNFLANGGGQADAIGAAPSSWTHITGNVFSIVGVDYKLGDRCIGVANAVAADSYTRQGFSVNAGDIWELAGWIRTPSGLSGTGQGATLHAVMNGGAGMELIEGQGVLDFGAADFYIGRGPADSSTGWEYYRAVFRVNQTDTLYIYMQLGGDGTCAGTAYFDGIVLRRLPENTYGTVYDAFDGNNLAPSVRQDGKKIARGWWQPAAGQRIYHGGAVVYPAGYFSSVPIPLISGGISYEPRGGASGFSPAINTALPQYRRLLAINRDEDGCDIIAELFQKTATYPTHTSEETTGTTITSGAASAAGAGRFPLDADDEYVESPQLSTFSGSPVIGNSQDEYTCNYRYRLITDGNPAKPWLVYFIEVILRLEIYNGSAWQLVATKTLYAESEAGAQTDTGTVEDSIAGYFDGAGGTYALRLKVESVTTSGGINTFTISESVLNAADFYYRTRVGTENVANMTPDSDDSLALEVFEAGT